MNGPSPRKSKKSVGPGLIFGTAIGSGIGLVLGDAIFGDTGTGLVFGAAMGLVLGTILGLLRRKRINAVGTEIEAVDNDQIE